MSRAASQLLEPRCPNTRSSRIPACAILFEIRQLRSRQSKPDRACGSRFAIDESARRERFDHLVHHRRRDAEEPLKIRSAGGRPWIFV